MRNASWPVLVTDATRTIQRGITRFSRSSDIGTSEQSAHTKRTVQHLGRLRCTLLVMGWKANEEPIVEGLEINGRKRNRNRNGFTAPRTFRSELDGEFL